MRALTTASLDRRMYLEVKVQDNNHLPITGLEQSMLDIIVQNVHLISSDGREAETWANDKVNNCQVVSEVRPAQQHQRERYYQVSTVWLSWTSLKRQCRHAGVHTVDVGLQGALHSLLSDVGADVQVLQLGVAAVEVDHQGVLFHNAL